MEVSHAGGQFLFFHLPAAPPTRGKQNGRGGKPSGYVHGLRAPPDYGGMHEAEPGKHGRNGAPYRGAAEVAVDSFRDDGGDDQHEKQKTVSQALYRSPINRAIESALDRGTGGGKPQRGKGGVDG